MLRLVSALALPACLLGARAATAAFPAGFLWGTAIAGFQTEMGGLAAHEDTPSLSVALDQGSDTLDHFTRRLWC